LPKVRALPTNYLFVLKCTHVLLVVFVIFYAEDMCIYAVCACVFMYSEVLDLTKKMVVTPFERDCHVNSSPGLSKSILLDSGKETADSLLSSGMHSNGVAFSCTIRL